MSSSQNECTLEGEGGVGKRTRVNKEGRGMSSKLGNLHRILSVFDHFAGLALEELREK